jgi:peptide/nickel transport system substrate-binding protein
VKRSRAFFAALVVMGLLAAACGDDGDSDAGQGGGGTAATTSAAKQPVTGGVLNMATFSEPASLDTLVSTGSGTTGGIEMAAIYDTIMRFDPASGKYEGRTAESLTPNADFTEYTIKLKPNIKFSDGTAYDATAVVFGLNRHRSGQEGAPPCAETVSCPRNTTSSNVYMNLVKDLQVVDAVTIKATMKEPWSGFGFALSDEASMIPSPTALKATCTDPTKPIRECSFGLKPVGAGPFILERFAPKESISMVRNPNYHGGPAYLDGLKFVSLQDQGAEKSFEALKSGTVQAAYLRAPSAVAAAKDAKLPGFSEFNHGGGLFLLNTGVPTNCSGGQPAPTCTGKPDGPTESNPPTKSLKVRQAFAAAIDPKVIDTRANQGKGLPGSELFQKDFRWYPNVPGPKYDLDQAKKLVAEAKAEGWDGKVRVLYSNAPFSVDVATAVEAMLRAAGFDPTVDTTKDTTAQVTQVSTRRDYDITGWGTNLTSDDGAAASLAQNLSSTSSSNHTGYKNPEMDAAIKSIRGAKSDAEKVAGFKKVAELVARDVPLYAWSVIEARIAWNDKVNGVVPNHSVVIFLDKVWMEK